jgi:hypothetical protein
VTAGWGISRADLGPTRLIADEPEPWLFTINRNGVIAARLEGAFGINAFRQALKAATT